MVIGSRDWNDDVTAGQKLPPRCNFGGEDGDETGSNSLLEKLVVGEAEGRAFRPAEKVRE
jgi:hypothetical protein